MREIKDRIKLEEYIQYFQLNKVLPKQLNDYLHLFAVKQGESICRQGETANYLYILVEGKVKIYTTSVEGKTLILSFKTPLEMVGDLEYIRKTEILNTVEAVTDVVMIRIDNRYLHQYAYEYAPFLQFLLEVITKKFYIKNAATSFNILYPVEVRLASYLLSVSFDEKDPLYNGENIVINLKDTANLIGTSYRHLNRVIQHFCMEGLIEKKKGSISVKNRDGLTKLASRNIYE